MLLIGNCSIGYFIFPDWTNKVDAAEIMTWSLMLRTGVKDFKNKHKSLQLHGYSTNLCLLIKKKKINDVKNIFKKYTQKKKNPESSKKTP